MSLSAGIMTGSSSDLIPVLPHVWSDDSRMDFMFSAFPSDSKGSIQPLADYQSYKSWSQWGYNVLVTRPLTWSVRKFHRLATGTLVTQNVYVLFRLMQEKADELLAYCHGNRIRCIKYSRLHDRVRDMFREDTDLCLVLLNLQKSGKVNVFAADKGETLLKFCKERQRRVSVIGQFDVAVTELKDNLDDLEVKTSSMEEEISRLMSVAKDFLKKQLRSSAKQMIRKKKRIESSLNEKLAIQSNLEEMLTSILSAQEHAAILSSYETGSAALKMLVDDPVLDRARELSDQVKEVLESQNDLSLIVSRDMSDDDTEDLEAELEALVVDDELLKKLEGLDVCGDDVVVSSIPDDVSVATKPDGSKVEEPPNCC